MTENRAAWMNAPHARFAVGAAPYPVPEAEDVIVRNAFVAVNPLEYKIQDNNPQIGGSAIRYPTILGADLAGTIVTVGDKVKNFRPGDRVIANASGAQSGQPSMSAFQHFTRVAAASTIAVPDHIPLEAASVLPLACDTAIAGLFPPEQLGLSIDKLNGVADSASEAAPVFNSVLLVWGGSSSVGCCVTQFARAAGYEVYAVASRRNHDLCRVLGASKTFDYADPDVENSIVAGLEGRTVAGAYDCIADAQQTIPVLARILAKAEGSKKITAVLTPQVTTFDGGVTVTRVSIPAVRGTPIDRICHTWIAEALDQGMLNPKPEPCIIGKGLEAIQHGVDKVKQGVSASKIVVKL